MNTQIHSLLFPQSIIARPHPTEAMFHGVNIPATARQAEAFYRSLPCVGWVAREFCRQHPKTDLDQVLKLSLEALRLQAGALSAADSDDHEYEAKVMEVIQNALRAAFPTFQHELKNVGTEPAPDPERRPVILVADDCPITRLLIQTELRKAGLDPRLVNDGAEALLLAPFCRPDLILLDVQMERLGGLQTSAYLRRSYLVGHPPIIFLSADNDKDAVVRGFEAGGADYIAKPFERREALARIRAHLEIRSLQLQVETTNAQLRRANLAKDRLLTVTTHDLRSPLTAIRGLTQFVEDGSLGTVNKKQAETLKQVLSTTEGMLALVNDLLDVSTLDDDAIKLDRAPRDLAGTLRLVAWICQPSAQRKEITLRVEAPESGLNANCDETRIQRVLENLVFNAIKFSPSHTAITLGARKEGGLLRIFVDDCGPGVPEAEQAKLFTDYGRTSVRPTGGESSTGLGLAICKRIVHAHGGVILMRNRTIGGAHFEFCLAADEASPTPPSTPPALPARATRFADAPMHEMAGAA